eukprot:7663303-Pyramimonas_sp.AAC.1
MGTTSSWKPTAKESGLVRAVVAGGNVDSCTTQDAWVLRCRRVPALPRWILRCTSPRVRVRGLAAKERGTLCIDRSAWIPELC